MTPLLLALTLNSPAHPPRPPVFYPPPQPVPVYQGPAYPFPAPVLPGEPHPPRPLTVQEFARVFVPTPGFHVVCLLHPVTCEPVTVAFTLPHGCGAPKVKVRKRELEFDYGRREVKLDFRRNGTVDVRNR